MNSRIALVALYSFLGACGTENFGKTDETADGVTHVANFQTVSNSVEFRLAIPTEEFSLLQQSVPDSREPNISMPDSSDENGGVGPIVDPKFPDQPPTQSKIELRCADGASQWDIKGMKLQVTLTEYSESGGASRIGNSFPIECPVLQLVLRELNVRSQYVVEVNIWGDGGALQFTGTSSLFTTADRRIELVMHRPLAGDVLVDIIFPPTKPDVAFVTCVFQNAKERNECRYKHAGKELGNYSQCIAAPGSNQCTFEVREFGYYDVTNGCMGALLKVNPGDKLAVKFDSCQITTLAQ